jgi:DNA-binding NtrC family response regulator
MAKNPDPEFLVRAGRLLQTEGETFPALAQKVLDLAERTWSPLKASLNVGGASLKGHTEFPAGETASFAVARAQRPLGTLTFEVPTGFRASPVPLPETGEALALLLAQEFELRRLPGFDPGADLVGSSGAMQEVFRLVEKASASRETVLLIGESGVGKERLAEVIHRLSASSGPFVVFNGSALPETMVETELFGHVQGLGGKFREAQGGTLFLDEVADLSLPVQGRLLRVLSEREVRLVVSTGRNLDALLAAGKFRADLHSRLAGFPIRVPPLRDRGSDIIALADHFVARFSLQTGRTIKRISTPALEMLLTYPWPGNVRELENVMERAVLLSDDEVLHGYHLPPSLQSSVHSGTRMHGRLADRLDSLEYEMLVEALKASQGNITQAARELGLTKRIMGLRLKKFELDYRTFRKGPSEFTDDDD